MTTSLFISVLLALLQSELVKDKVLKPSAVVFKYSNITSVAALRSNSWIVLFFGTGTGLLIKVGLGFVGCCFTVVLSWMQCIAIFNLNSPTQRYNGHYSSPAFIFFIFECFKRVILIFKCPSNKHGDLCLPACCGCIPQTWLPHCAVQFKWGSTHFTQDALYPSASHRHLHGSGKPGGSAK